MKVHWINVLSTISAPCPGDRSAVVNFIVMNWMKRAKKILAVAEILGQKYNATVDQVLLAFVLKHPSQIIPVIGSTKIERLKLAYDAARINIEREEWFMLWRASKGHEIP